MAWPEASYGVGWSGANAGASVRVHTSSPALPHHTLACIARSHPHSRAAKDALRNHPIGQVASDVKPPRALAKRCACHGFTREYNSCTATREEAARRKVAAGHIPRRSA